MLKSINKDPKQKAMVLFVIKAILLYIFWFISYDYFIAPNQKVDQYLNFRVATDAGKILNVLGYEGSTQPGTECRHPYHQCT